MARPSLLVCPSCERHVRVVDSSCPFCGLAMSESVRAGLTLRSPGRRLGRAALYAFGMGTLTFASACSSSSGGENGDGGDLDAHETGTIYPPYGHPAYGSPYDSGAGDSGEGDSAADAEGAEGGDAGDGGFFPPYGHPADAGSDE